MTDRARPSVAVIIPAYTMRRWEQIQKAVASARAQTIPPEVVVLCIDNNADLLLQAESEWGKLSDAPPVKVIPNRHRNHLDGVDTHRKVHGTARRFGAGTARNTAAESVAAEILAFLDDDAWAEPDWLEQLLAVYDSTSAVAVGGAPHPDFETSRPAWFPRNFDWVFGCAYEGLPTEVAQLGHLIGANMSVRSTALAAIGGFHSVDFDDLDLSMRLAEKFGPGAVYYNPQAVVHHRVPAERVTWRYFRRRCLYVNREKVKAFHDMGAAANLKSERGFVWRALRIELQHGVIEATGKNRRPGAYRSLAAMLIGITLAGFGHVRGRLDALLPGQESVRLPRKFNGPGRSPGSGSALAKLLRLEDLGR